jgi:predicted transcriptional regulator
MMESDMQVSFPEDVTDRLRAKASQMNLAPEEVVRFIVEMVLGPSPREIEQDYELRAALERAQEDIRAGRVVSHDEVLEWHHNHPK